MNHSISIKSFLSIIVIALIAVGCAASSTTTNSTAGTKAKTKAKPYDPSGTWEYVVETPDGANGGNLVIEGNPGAYTATLETDQFGAIEILDVDVQGQNMTGSIEVMGNVAELECTFDGDTFSGTLYLGDDGFPLEGKRVSK